MSTSTSIAYRVAVFHQAIAPPSFGGVSKPAKAGGYRDSCADIAVGLNSAKRSASNATGIKVILPSHDQTHMPAETDEASWSFPDNEEGIKAAIARGANVLWMNTVLHRSHPLFKLYKPEQSDLTKGSGIKFVGQLPEHADDYDDKVAVNPWLANADDKRILADGFPRSIVISHETTGTEEGIQQAVKRIQTELGLPCVLKASLPGRGSMGVKVVHTVEQLREHAATLFKDCPVILAEEFLGGEEITIAVMPPGEFDQPIGNQPTHWTLPIVIRSQHIDDVTPYSGVQVVALNSAAITPEQYLQDKEEYEKVERRVKRAGEIMGTKAVVRIDCRRNSRGEFKLFDVNMKPNASGAGRPGRDDWTSLVGMSAQAIGWDYPTLLINQVRVATPLRSLEK
ncbi:hypothetical protein QFC22_001503 [Naganishia vaughanmartiniae]|uniref:Uncharacterized protein n=1 Tax=Naganishia vaughanmartiniae TaxID=1424756 RepID=A0ACC2XIQ2_9TREE|nr:hypothetical protein QFC22_001503 [Naganishia vaughanmartiniae]